MIQTEKVEPNDVILININAYSNANPNQVRTYASGIEAEFKQIFPRNKVVTIVNKDESYELSTTIAIIKNDH